MSSLSEGRAISRWSRVSWRVLGSDGETVLDHFLGKSPTLCCSVGQRPYLGGRQHSSRAHIIHLSTPHPSHPLMYLFIRTPLHSHLLLHMFICLLLWLSTHSFSHSFTNSPTHLLIHLCTHSFIHLLFHPSLFHSLTWSRSSY